MKTNSSMQEPARTRLVPVQEITVHNDSSSPQRATYQEPIELNLPQFMPGRRAFNISSGDMSTAAQQCCVASLSAVSCLRENPQWNVREMCADNGWWIVVFVVVPCEFLCIVVRGCCGRRTLAGDTGIRRRHQGCLVHLRRQGVQLHFCAARQVESHQLHLQQPPGRLRFCLFLSSSTYR